MFGILRWFGILRVCEEVQEKGGVEPYNFFLKIRSTIPFTIYIFCITFYQINIPYKFYFIYHKKIYKTQISTYTSAIKTLCS